jgi:hypothetical protein
MITDPAKAMESQFWFACRLKDGGLTVDFFGIHAVASRWEVIRTAIVNFGFADRVIPKTNETYAQAFKRATGTPLNQENVEFLNRSGCGSPAMLTKET